MNRLRGFCLAFAAAVALIAAGVGPTPARAAGDAQLALMVTQDLFGAMNIEKLMTDGAKSSFRSFDNLQPGWGDMAAAALEEEVRANPPFQPVVARRVAAIFTTEELRAGHTILSDPVMQEIFAAAASGRQVAEKPCGAPCMAALGQPAGEAFMRKFSDTDRWLGKEAQNEVVVAMMPGFLRRLADKIEARARTSRAR
jgi:hypothetical protein